ncbi:MAG: ABC transporter ATP-binding protein [Alphaproteobacteria bacterium]|nr:MAG: ABC transporter ATP-binding protein [Alphaproteobacteria bacterium]
MASAEALSCRGVTVRYGDFVAVDTVSIDFAPGAVTSVIGPNGAGKTTLINVLSGRQAPQVGSVRLGVRDITAMQAHRRARLGIGRSFQITRVFPEITVLENVRLAAQARLFRLQPFWRSAGRYAALDEAADGILDEVGLQHLRDHSADTLSHGDQRALEVAITLATRPGVLLLDEPLAGVGEKEIDRTMRLIERAARGRTVVLVEHNISAVMVLSHRVVVMTQGKVLATGTPNEIRRNTAARRAYLGDEDA